MADAGSAPREWRAAGAGLDAAFERSAFLSDTFYRNADALLQQVEKSGAMGVNRGFEVGARKGGEWFIEEQRFADTVIGAGVNRNRMDLIDAGLRALEWGYAQQSGDGYAGATVGIQFGDHVDATGSAGLGFSTLVDFQSFTATASASLIFQGTGGEGGSKYALVCTSAGIVFANEDLTTPPWIEFV